MSYIKDFHKQKRDGLRSSGHGQPGLYEDLKISKKKLLKPQPEFKIYHPLETRKDINSRAVSGVDITKVVVAPIAPAPPQQPLTPQQQAHADRLAAGESWQLITPTYRQGAVSGLVAAAPREGEKSAPAAKPSRISIPGAHSIESSSSSGESSPRPPASRPPASVVPSQRPAGPPHVSNFVAPPGAQVAPPHAGPQLGQMPSPDSGSQVEPPKTIVRPTRSDVESAQDEAKRSLDILDRARQYGFAPSPLQEQKPAPEENFKGKAKSLGEDAVFKMPQDSTIEMRTGRAPPPRELKNPQP